MIERMSGIADTAGWPVSPSKLPGLILAVGYLMNFLKVSKIEQRRDGAGSTVDPSPPRYGTYR
jgi:hypothetical protein